jgi:hypothetical protein
VQEQQPEGVPQVQPQRAKQVKEQAQEQQVRVQKQQVQAVPPCLQAEDYLPPYPE